MSENIPDMNRLSIHLHVRRSYLRMRALGRAGVCALVFAGLTGCLSGAPSTPYLLEPASVGGLQVSESNVVSIGLSTITVPGYVRENSITSRGPGATLTLDENSEWAEVPENALTRTLAESLRLRSGADVLIAPLPRGFDPQVRVEVTFDRLLANAGGIADLAGQVQLISGDGRDLLKVLPFQLLQRGRGGNYDGFFDAMAVSLDDLARLILEALGPSS